MCIRFAVTFFTELLLRNDRGYTHRHTDRWEGFMKYAVEMGSGAQFHTDWLRHSKFNWGGVDTDSIEIAQAYFQFSKIRKVG
jgi:hypothetical protein